MYQLKASWAIARKDLAVWIRSPTTIAITIVPTLALILVLVLQAAAVTGSPVAIVNLDNGGSAAQELQQIAQHYDGFLSAPVMSEEQAEEAYRDLKASAVLTIPEGFSKDLAAGGKPAVSWQVRNFNDDTANDLRRALPDVIEQFLEERTTAGENGAHITIEEHDMHPTDAGFVAFNLIAVLVVLLLQAGIVNAGLAAVREWETGSVKELLISPASPFSVIAGKVLAGTIVGDLAGCVGVGVATLAGILPVVSPKFFALTLLTMTLVSVFGAGLGVILGATLRVTERVSALSVTLALYLFFLAGGITYVAYLPGWLQTLARFVPATYAMDSLRDSLLYSSTSGLANDLLFLSVAAVLALMVGVPMFRRGLAH